MNALTISLVTIMIPGVIMAMIYDTYTQHKAWDSFRYILMSVVFGILTYLSMQAVISIYQFFDGIEDTKNIVWYTLSVWSAASGGQIKISPLEIAAGGVISIPLGLFAVYLNTKRSLHTFLLKKGISNKYGDDNVFIRSVELMYERSGQCYVVLRDEDMIISGQIYLYNENEKTQEIGLLNATVSEASTQKVLFTTNFIYLSKEYGKIMIFENILENSNDQ